MRKITDFSIRFINCWADIFNFKRLNWATFEFFRFYIDVDKVTGDCEVGLIILGIGFVTSFICSKNRRNSFVKEMNERIREGSISYEDFWTNLLEEDGYIVKKGDTEKAISGILEYYREKGLIKEEDEPYFISAKYFTDMDNVLITRHTIAIFIEGVEEGNDVQKH